MSIPPCFSQSYAPVAFYRTKGQIFSLRKKRGTYIIKVNNAGEEIERILFKANEVESPETENNGSEVENGSNGETNDKE